MKYTVKDASWELVPQMRLKYVCDRCGAQEDAPQGILDPTKPCPACQIGPRERALDALRSLSGNCEGVQQERMVVVLEYLFDRLSKEVPS